MVIRQKYGAYGLDVTDVLPTITKWLSPDQVDVSKLKLDTSNTPTIGAGISPGVAAIFGLVALGGLGFLLTKVLK